MDRLHERARREADEALRAVTPERNSVGDAVTDEASAIEALGLQPKLVESDMTNLKVTYPRDLEVAAWLLGRG